MSFMFLLLSVWFIRKLKSQTWPGIYIALGQPLKSFFKHSSQSSPFEMSELFALGPNPPEALQLTQEGQASLFSGLPAQYDSGLWGPVPPTVKVSRKLLASLKPHLRPLQIHPSTEHTLPLMAGGFSFTHASVGSRCSWDQQWAERLRPRTHHLHQQIDSLLLTTHSAWTLLSCFDSCFDWLLPHYL